MAKNSSGYIALSQGWNENRNMAKRDGCGKTAAIVLVFALLCVLFSVVAPAILSADDYTPRAYMPGVMSAGLLCTPAPRGMSPNGECDDIWPIPTPVR